MSQKKWKRVTAGALAAQMLCAPAASASAIFLTEKQAMPFSSTVSSLRKEGMPRVKLVSRGKTTDATVKPSIDDNDSQMEKQPSVESTSTLEGVVSTPSTEAADEVTHDADAQRAEDQGGTVEVKEDGEELPSAEDSSGKLSSAEDGSEELTTEEDGGEGLSEETNNADGTGTKEEQAPVESSSADETTDVEQPDTMEQDGDKAPSEELPVSDDVVEAEGASGESGDKDTPDVKGQEAPVEETADKLIPEVEATVDMKQLDVVPLQAGDEEELQFFEPGTLAAVGTSGYYEVANSLKGQEGYKPEGGTEDGTDENEGWFYPVDNFELGCYITKESMFDLIAGNVELQRRMARIPNYKFIDWRVYKGIECLDAETYFATILDYVQNEELLGYPNNITYGYQLPPNEAGNPELNWMDESTAEAVLDTLLKTGHLFTVDGEPVESIADWQSKYYMLYFGGSWQKSTNATLVDGIGAIANKNSGSYDAKLYAASTKTIDSLAKMGASALAEETVVATPTDDLNAVLNSETQYFTRVEANVDSITLNVTTYEPGSVVYVERIFDGVTTQYAAKERKFINGPDASNSAKNDEENPARAEWIVTIPLEQARGDEKLYNELQIVVIPPADRSDDLPEEPGMEILSDVYDALPKENERYAATENAEKYTVYVQRLNEPKILYAKGNTPAGAIKNYISEKDKETVLNSFSSNYKWTQPAERPSGDTYMGYRLNGQYNHKAWSDWSQNDKWKNYGGWSKENTGNLDLNEEAVVVHLDSQVELPALEIVDSLGRTDKVTVAKRTLELKTVDQLNTDVVFEENPVTAAVTTMKANVNTDQADVLDLRGLKIVPGVYDLEYTYLDPVTEENYTSLTNDLFTVATERVKTFHRPLIVLPKPGDVDMDGAVTAADGAALTALLNKINGMGNSEEASKKITRAGLFLYRVCDVNGDGKCNAEDVEKICGTSGAPLFRSRDSAGGSDYRYWPLGREVSAGNERAAQAPQTPVTTSAANKAGLSLKYLGKGTMVPDESADTLEAVNLDETFWVGVKLDDAAKLNATLGNAKALTVTIAVDGRYLKLAGNVDYSKWVSLGDLNIQIYGTHQKGQLSAEDTLGAVPVRSGHPSKARASFEDSGEVWEYQLTVTHPEGIALTDGYLLKVPLKLVALPINGKVVELAFGMRELCVVGTNVTAAYDCRQPTDIFGGATQNLANYLEYRECDEVPLGQDSSEAILMENRDPSGEKHDTVYGEAFYCATGKSGTLSGTLPDGIEYKGDGVFEGIPLVVGVFEDIYLGKSRFKIVVEKAPLTLTVQPGTRYYGEENPQATFVYNVDQIKASDKDGQAGLTGAMGELASLIDGYVEPEFVYRETKNGTMLLTKGTPANQGNTTYFVGMYGGEATNYTIYYADEVKASVRETEGWAPFTIQKRPVYVDEILTRPVFSKASTSETTRAPDDGGKYLTGNSGTDFTLTLPTVDENGLYGGLPLTDNALHTNEKTDVVDTLTIQYVGHYVKTEKDPASVGFTVTEPEETRDITIDTISFIGGAMENYELLSPEPVQSTVKDGGRLLRNYVEKLEISKVPTKSGPVDNDENAKLKFTHGDTLSMAGAFQVYAPFNTDSDDEANQHYLDFAYAKEHGFDIFWAKIGTPVDGQDRPAEDRIDAEATTNVSRAELDGCYLWVHALGYNEATKQVIDLYSRSQHPMEIEKKPLTLTLEPVERYYGEPNPEDSETKVTYSVADLSPADQAGKTGNLWTDFTTATLPGYTVPTIKMVTSLDTNAASVEQGSAAYTDQYYAILSGASSTDYEFRYTRTMYNGTVTESNVSGYNVFKVYPRPIIVAGIKDVVDSNGVKTVPREIYADDTSFSFKEHAQAGGETVTVNMPVYGDTYRRQISSEKVDNRYLQEDVTIGLPLTGSALYNADTVTISYVTSYLPDSRTAPHFILTADSESRTVELTDVAIEGNSNYTLVFTNTENAEHGYPGTATGQSLKADYQTTGIVKSREITNVTLRTPLPKTRYSHGDSLTLDGLTVEIAYKNNTTKAVVFNGLENGNFADAEIHLTWDAPWTEAGPNTELTTKADLVLFRTKDNGRKLYVTVEQLGNFEPVSAEPLTISVGRRTVTLSAKNQYRYYGEENAPYSFTFKTSQLAESDRKILVEQGIMKGLTNPATLEGEEAERALAAINEAYSAETGYTAYVEPVFETHAKADSSPGGGLKDGAYLLELSGGAMTNYKFAYEEGTIRIFRRPIAVTQVVANPVATLPIESNRTTAEITLGQGRGPADSMEIILPGSGHYSNATYDSEGYGKYSNEFDADGQGLPLSDSAIVGSDTVYILMTADFHERSKWGTIPDEDFEKPWSVTISDMKLTGISAVNYCLIATHGPDPTVPQVDDTAMGSLTKRRIKSITLKREPALGYNYGDSTLGILANRDLAALQFEVEYERAGTMTMSYETLYKEVPPEIYYWDESWPVPGADWQEKVNTESLTEEEAKKEIEEYIDKAVNQMKEDKADYKAEVNDHLSISPITKNATEFSHEGKHLLILVRKRDVDGESYAVPVVTTNAITITPRDIAYTVQVEDKVYNGNRTATGELTLTDVYGTDDVQIDTDSITFDFIDPNVAYEQAPTAHSYGEPVPITVEVGNIRLIGKDAANYKIDSKIDRNYKATVWGRPSAAPQATITKAERAVPTVEEISLFVNEHTNILTVSHNGELAGDPGDEHNGEVHWEYALEYPAAEPETAPEGEDTPQSYLELIPWQDEMWFGGEKVEGSTAAIQPTAVGDQGLGSRPALPRDTWFRAALRIGESWNYKESPVIYSAALEELLAKVGRVPEEEDPGAGEDSGTEENPGTEETQGASEDSGGQRVRETSMGKTYRYRLDVYTIPEKEGDKTAALDAVWFNDIDRYADKEALDEALGNTDRARGYHDYYWDIEKSREVSYPWDLTAAASDTAPVNGNVRLYATTEAKVIPGGDDKPPVNPGNSGGGDESPQPKYKLSLTLERIEAKVGDEPMTLEYKITPEPKKPLKMQWSSSDPNVVKVDENGVLTFVGEGEAIITVKLQGMSVQASIPVKVVRPTDEKRPLPESHFAGKAFNVYATEPFMELDENMLIHPDWTMSRGELAMLLVKLLAISEDETPGEAMAFNDIREGDPWAEAVWELSRWGIVKGMLDGNFYPEQKATRAEVVVMLSRMLRLKQSKELAPFVDVSEKDTWAAPYLKELADQGVIIGTSTSYNRFSPTRLATRAEVATFVARLLVYQVKADDGTLKIPADVPEDHWAYRYILRAVNGGVAFSEEAESGTGE